MDSHIPHDTMPAVAAAALFPQGTEIAASGLPPCRVMRCRRLRTPNAPSRANREAYSLVLCLPAPYPYIASMSDFGERRREAVLPSPCRADSLGVEARQTRLQIFYDHLGGRGRSERSRTVHSLHLGDLRA